MDCKKTGEMAGSGRDMPTVTVLAWVADGVDGPGHFIDGFVQKIEQFIEPGVFGP